MLRLYFLQTLRMHTQGCQGCQKTRNFVRNSKILIARSTIQPKWSKIKNNLPFFKEFWWISSWFLILLNFGWMVDLAMSIFEFLTKFLIFWLPWHPWVCVRSDLKQIWAIPPTVAVATGPLEPRECRDRGRGGGLPQYFVINICNNLIHQNALDFFLSPPRFSNFPTAQCDIDKLLTCIL